MQDTTTEALLNYLFSFLTAERQRRIEAVLQHRTRYLTVVLEDIYQPHNASAVIRSCDCFGIQDLHIIENEHQFKPSRHVAKGANRWIDIHTYNQHRQNTDSCLGELKKNDYRIVATSPHHATPLKDLDLSKGKVALVFGTELTGISETVEAYADEMIALPMYGFTESFNISVSVALCLQNLYERLISSGIDWKLNPADKREIKLNWVRQIVRNSEILERDFLSKLS